MNALVFDKDGNTELEKLGGLSLDDSNEFENRVDRSSVNASYPNMEQFKKQMMSSPSLMSPVTSTPPPPPPSSSSIQAAGTGAPKQHGYADEQTKLELQKQLEYYFSAKNLQNDSYLRSQMDAEDYVAISLIAQFKRIKQLTSDMNLIISIIKQSSQLQLDPTSTRLRSVGGSAGGLITINTFSKKPSKSYINSSDQKAMSLLQQQQRCVLILREVAPEASLEKIKDLFSNKEPDCPACHQCESAGNDSWYVTFNNEEQAQKALQYLKLEVQTFMDKPIRARIKAHTTIPRSTSSLLNNNSSSNSNSTNKLTSLSPSSPPLSSNSSQNQPGPPQTPTQSLPASYNQQLLAYETPPSSSYMSQTSSPSPAPIYSNINQELSYHDGNNIQLVVQKPPDFDMQSINSNISNKISNQSQQFNYLNFSQSPHLKYLPNGKPMNLISNQHYLFSPGPPINSPNGTPRPIIAQTNNQYWQLNNGSQVFTTPPKQSLKYNNDDPQSQSSVPINKQASTSNLSLNNSNNNNSSDTFKATELTESEATKSFTSPNPTESHSITELSPASLISYPAAQGMGQSILQIPSYYQPQQSQQPQMIQIPINSNSYNRSSPAAIQAFYQSLSQSPSQQYIPLISSNNNNQQSTPILSSTSSSSLNSVALSNQVVQQGPGQPITYSNLPGGYQHPQFIIQNPQYLSHQNVNQTAQISIISNSGSSAGAQLMGPGITLNSSYYNSNSTKSSTPAPTSSGSSSNNTLSGSSNGAQQITSPPIYNPNSYFIATNLPVNNNNTSNNNNNNPNNNINSNNSNGASVSAALTAAYQYYHSIQMNSAFPHQHPHQQYNIPNNQNIAQLNSYHSGMQPTAQMYPGNQQPHQTQQSMPIFYEIVQPQYDGSSNPIPLASFSQGTAPPSIQLQNQSQTNLTNETQNQLTKSSSENASNSTSNVSTSVANNLSANTQATNNALAIASQTPVQFGNLMQQSAVQSQQHTSPPAVFIYPGNPQNNLIINQLNTNTSQLLTTPLGGTSSSNSNGQSVPVFNNSSISNGNARRANSGNSNSAIESRNSSFGNQPHINYQLNSHRSYNTNPRIKYMSNSNESSAGVISNQHHSNSHHHNHHPHSNQNFSQNMNSSSTYQSNKTYHQSVNSSNSHSIVSESTASSSRSSTSNTPMTLVGNLNEMSKTTNDDSNNGHKNESEKLAQVSKSPPNNSDLVSFPPLSNIPVNTNIQQQPQQQKQTNSNEASELESVQLDPAIICISNSTLPSSPAIINSNASTSTNKYTKSTGNLNKILATSTAEHSTGSENSNSSSVNNQAPPVSNKHQSNLKYEMIKSHLGYNRTTHFSTNSNPDYHQQQKQPNNNNNNNNSNTQQHHHQMHQGSQANQTYSNNNNNMYKLNTGGSSGNYSRKSIDGIHSQNNNQRMHSHHGINQGSASVSGKFYSNNNNERSSSTGGGGGSNKNYHGRQNSSNNSQASNNNSAENKSSSALQTVINNESNQHVSSPSFNRKQKGSNSHQNKGHTAQNFKENNSKTSNEGNQKFSNTHIHTNANSADSSNLIAQSNSSLMSSSSSLQNNEDDMNSLSNNSWNNKKLTFAEIVQQKANSVNGSESKLVNQTAQIMSQQDVSSGCFSNTSSVSVTSANSSQATTPTTQPQATYFAVTSSSDQSAINDQSQKPSCFALNQSNSPTITNSSIQV